MVLAAAVSAASAAIPTGFLDDRRFGQAAVEWRPKVAQDFAGARVHDDLPRAVLLFGNDANAAKQRPLLNDRAEALLFQLADDAVDDIAR